MRTFDAGPLAMQLEPHQRQAGSVGTASYERPGLPYLHALDACALLAWRAGAQTTIVTASAFFAEQLAGRLGDLVHGLVWTGAHPQPSQLASQASISAAPARGATTVIWADPQRHTVRRELAIALSALAGGGRLVVLVGGPAGRFVARPAGDVAAPGRVLGLPRLLRLLNGAGLSIAELKGYGSPASYLWGLAGQALVRLGRAALADRSQVRHRELFAIEGWRAALTPLAVVVARHGPEAPGGDR